MASGKGLPLILAGGLALLLMGRSKKKKESSAGAGPKDDEGVHGGGELDEPTEKNTPGGGGSGGGGSGGGSKAGGGSVPSNLAKDAVWVSSDCKKVVYGDGVGEAFWDSKGLPAAQKFIDANYHDPYEIAKMMIISMAPCAVEFPVAEDDMEPMEEEFGREMFNRNFKEVYYLIQFLHDNISKLMDREEYIIEFDDRCDIKFVGEEWFNSTAERMARFYTNYMYPSASDYYDHAERFKSWPLADPDEKSMIWWDNIATAIINRMNPECGISIVEAFDKTSSDLFFSSRPGLEAVYQSLLDLVNKVQDQQQDGLDFEKLANLNS